MAEKYKHYTLSLELLDGKTFKFPLAIPCGEKGDPGSPGSKGKDAALHGAAGVF